MGDVIAALKQALGDNSIIDGAALAETPRGWSRLGTTKSRAPSGVDLIRVGVSISTKALA